MTLWVILTSFVLILATGASIGVGLGLSSAIVLYGVLDMPLIVVVQRMFTSVDSFSFMAVPFFMLAGAFMSEGGVTRRIVDFSMALVGALAGGLALVVAVAGMFFAALSGSSAATTAAIGASMIDEMERRGYPRSFAAAVVASGGTVGIVIPPSITMVVYGSIANTSIADLFMAGFVPGILMGVTMCVVSWVISKKNGYKGEGQFSLRRMARSFRECFWALMMPVIILGGIYGGIFTPTEAAAVSVIYGLFVGIFIYKQIRLEELYTLLLDSVSTTATVMFITAAASLFAYVLTRARLDVAISTALQQVTGGSTIIFFIIVNIILLIAGCFLDSTSALYIFTPLFVPVANALGIDLVHLGVVMIVNLAIGLFTPPVGVNLYVACGVADVNLKDISKAVLPLLIASIIVLLIVTYVPAVSLAFV